MKKYIIFLMVIMCAFFTGCKNGQAKNDNYDSYLSNNVEALNLNHTNNFSDLKMLSSDINKADIILIGEMHGTKVNYDIKMKFLNYIKKHDLKYLLIEDAYVSSVYINKYLDSGEEKYLKNAEIPSEEDHKFLKQLYEINSKLGSKDKIRVIGIDSGMGLISVDYLIDELSELELDTKSKSHFEKLITISKLLQEIDEKGNPTKSDYSEIKKLVINVNEEINDYKNYYEGALSKDKYIDFICTLDSIYNNYYYADFENSEKTLNEVYLDVFNNRDNLMYKNFKKVSEYLNGGKYFGQFGAAHTRTKSLSLSPENKPFATLINDENRLKVLSIEIIYEKCKFSYNGDTMVYSIYDPSNITNKYIKSDNSLIKLNGKKSPYFNSLDNNLSANFKPVDSKTATTDYFKYIIITKNSLEMLENNRN